MSDTDIQHLEADTMRKITWRLIPFLILCYLLALIDRSNIGMASLQMNDDLGLSKKVFGFAGSLFFFSYFLFEVPSNLALQKFGARKWIARIMVTWGLVSACTAFVQGQNSLFVMRFLLGAAEAGFFPGVVLYLTYWFPAAYRGRIIAIFMVAVPMGSFVGSPLSAMLLQADGLMGMRGWHWLFIMEGIPTMLLGLVCLFYLTDRPEQATWLSAAQRNWLSTRLESERSERKSVARPSVWQLFRSKEVLAMALVCSAASAAGSVLSVWQPSLLKSFGLTVMQTGLVNSVPYVIAAVLMVLWGRHSDKQGERRWHTAISLALIAGGMLGSFVVTSLAPTVFLLSCILVGAYSFKGPFWALSSSWLSASAAAAGLATINAVSNLIGGGLMVNAYGWIKEATGSYALALLPIALLTVVSIITLLTLSNDAHRAARSAQAKASV
jgi:sugar phosphate permease